MCLYFISIHNLGHKTFRLATAELEEACYRIGFQLIDESEDSRGCAPWETGHTPLLPLAVGGLRPPGYGWSIEGCMGLTLKEGS